MPRCYIRINPDYKHHNDSGYEILLGADESVNKLYASEWKYPNSSWTWPDYLYANWSYSTPNNSTTAYEAYVNIKAYSKWKITGCKYSTDNDESGSDVDILIDDDGITYVNCCVVNKSENNYYTFEVEENIPSTDNTIKFNLINCSINDDDTIVPEYADKEYVIICDDGYIFKDTPYIEVNDQIIYFILSDDGKQANIDITLGSSLVYTINANAVEDVPYYQLDLELTNCVSDVEAGSYPENTSLYPNLIPDDGYYFSNNDDFNIIPCIIDDNNTLISNFDLSGSITINGYRWYSKASRMFSLHGNYRIIATAVNPYDLEYCNCTENLTNCVSDSKETYLKGSLIKIQVNVSDIYKEIYVFNDAPEIQFNNGTILYFDISEDKLSADITFTVDDDFTIYAHAENPLVYHDVITNLTNCNLISANIFEESAGYTLELLAYDGYEFSDNIKIQYNWRTAYITSDFFYDDNTRVIYPISGSIWTDIEVEAIAIRTIESLSEFARIYKVNRSILNDLSKVRFYEISGESSVSIVDYGEFITSLFIIPFTLPDDIIGDNANIQLGIYDSGVPAPTLLYHDLEIDIGVIHVESKYNNVYDYKDSEVILHLPFTKDIDLPIEYCMNEDVHIKYKIDLYSGDVTIVIYSSFADDNIVYIDTDTMCTQIPFMQLQSNSIINELRQFTDNEIRQAYIEIKRPIPYNVFCEFGKPTVDYGIIGDYKGYIEVSDCTININCTRYENDMIKDLLKNGVIIK